MRERQRAKCESSRIAPQTKNPAEAGSSSKPATSRGLPQVVAGKELEAGGIEPPSRDHFEAGLLHAYPLV